VLAQNIFIIQKHVLPTQTAILEHILHLHGISELAFEGSRAC